MLRNTPISRRQALLALLVVVFTATTIRALLTEPETPASARADMLDPSAAAALAQRFPAPDAGHPSWPKDHGPHPEQFFESWAFSGRLQDDEENSYTFYFNVLRVSIQQESSYPASSWDARDVFTARLLLAAPESAPEVRESLARGALGLAGAEGRPLRVWIEDWEVGYLEESNAFELRAGDAGLRLDLRLTLPETPPATLPGTETRGYWWPGLAVAGELVQAGSPSPVQGSAQLERQWGRSLPLGSGQLALIRVWLVFASHDSALRCEQLQRREGGGIPLGSCIWRSADEHARTVPAQDVLLAPSADAAGTPNALRVSWPDGGVEVRLSPLYDPVERFLLPPWSGVLEFAEHGGGWAILELSNWEAETP